MWLVFAVGCSCCCSGLTKPCQRTLVAGLFCAGEYDCSRCVHGLLRCGWFLRVSARISPFFSMENPKTFCSVDTIYQHCLEVNRSLVSCRCGCRAQPRGVPPERGCVSRAGGGESLLLSTLSYLLRGSLRTGAIFSASFYSQPASTAAGLCPFRGAAAGSRGGSRGSARYCRERAGAYCRRESVCLRGSARHQTPVSGSLRPSPERGSLTAIATRPLPKKRRKRLDSSCSGGSCANRKRGAQNSIGCSQRSFT